MPGIGCQPRAAAMSSWRAARADQNTDHAIGGRQYRTSVPLCLCVKILCSSAAGDR